MPYIHRHLLGNNIGWQIAINFTVHFGVAACKVGRGFPALCFLQLQLLLNLVFC